MAYAFLNQTYIDSDNSKLIQFIERSVVEFEIPEGIAEIGSCAFWSCKKMEKITIPDTVKTLGSSCFRECNALKEITLPENVSYIGDNAFVNSTSIKELVIPPKVNAVLGWTCAGMTSLEKIIFQGNINAIAYSAFQNSYNCKVFDFTNCTSVPNLTIISAFSGINADAKILVPAALYDKWIVATNWVTYADYIVPVAFLPVIEIPEKASEGLLIENGVLKGRGSCTDNIIVVPEEVTGTEWQLFNNDNQIDTLILPEKGIRIAGYLGENSTLRVLMNYYNMNTSFGLSTAGNLEFISIIGSCDIDNYQFFCLPDGVKYDFSRCESVPVLSSA